MGIRSGLGLVLNVCGIPRFHFLFIFYSCFPLFFEPQRLFRETFNIGGRLEVAMQVVKGLASRYLSLLRVRRLS